MHEWILGDYKLTIRKLLFSSNVAQEAGRSLKHITNTVYWKCNFLLKIVDLRCFSLRRRIGVFSIELSLSEFH